MRITLLRGRPEERFKFAIGVLVGTVVALPVNVLALTHRPFGPELVYVLLPIVVCGAVFHRRAFAGGVSGAVVLVSFPLAVVAVLPSSLTNWHVSAGLLWLVALAILGCLYLVREAETRTGADVDASWLFSPQD